MSAVKLTDDHYYPPVGFHFLVEIDGFKEDADIRFQSVGGLNQQMQTEALKEGGENRFEHALPTRAKSSDLVLKRGLVNSAAKDSLTRWIRDTIEQFRIVPKNLTVKLLNEGHEPLMTWKVEHAWPKNWKVSDLNADKSELVIETIELSVNRCTLMEATR